MQQQQQHTTTTTTTLPPPAPPPAPPPPPPPHVVVKLGGAAITHKAGREQLDADALAAIAASLARLHRARSTASGGGLVVVHGAGSFGHHEAKLHGIAAGVDPAAQQPFPAGGFAATRASTCYLNSQVVRALVAAGVPAVALSPFSVAPHACSGGRLTSEAADRLAAAARALLGAGLVPVLHGDCVLDSAQGCAVLGGDALVLALALALRPHHAVFLTNVPGVFTRPPGQPGAELVRLVLCDADGSWRVENGGSSGGSSGSISTDAAHHDVTGGIAAKVEAAVAAAAGGVPVVIAQAATPAGDAAVARGPAAFVDVDDGGGGGAQLAATVVRRAV